MNKALGPTDGLPAYDLALLIAGIDPGMPITQVSNPILMIQNLMRQRKVLADEVIRLHKKGK